MDARKPRPDRDPSGPARVERRKVQVDPVRDAALRLLVEFERDRFPLGGRIERDEASFSQAEGRHLFRALITEALRHQSRIDWVLGRVLQNRSLADLPPWIRGALRLGAVQLLLFSGVAAHAAVDTSVTLATRYGHRGTSGLVNAVLRRIAREGRGLWENAGAEGGPDPASRIAIRTSHPEWLVRRWLARWGEERTGRVLAWDLTLPDYWLRVRPGGAGAPPSPPLGAVPGWIPGTLRLPPGARPAEEEGFGLGDWTIQDGSGILVGRIPPQVSGLVLDLCAAPGTKTGGLLERAVSGARVVAMDLSPGRLRRLRRGLARSMALEKAMEIPVEAVAADGRQIPLRAPWNGVLIDAPCSNLGVIRRRIDLKWRAEEEEIPRLAGVQASLLAAGARGVAPGGWLVYSVCTLEPEETTEQRDRFFATQPGWIPGRLPDAIPEAARGREGEMILMPGELETDGTYAFVALKGSEG